MAVEMLVPIFSSAPSLCASARRAWSPSPYVTGDRAVCRTSLSHASRRALMNALQEDQIPLGIGMEALQKRVIIGV